MLQINYELHKNTKNCKKKKTGVLYMEHYTTNG